MSTFKATGSSSRTRHTNQNPWGKATIPAENKDFSPAPQLRLKPVDPDIQRQTAGPARKSTLNPNACPFFYPADAPDPLSPVSAGTAHATTPAAATPASEGSAPALDEQGQMKAAGAGLFEEVAKIAAMISSIGGPAAPRIDGLQELWNASPVLCTQLMNKLYTPPLVPGMAAAGTAALASPLTPVGSTVALSQTEREKFAMGVVRGWMNSGIPEDRCLDAMRKACDIFSQVGISELEAMVLVGDMEGARPDYKALALQMTAIVDNQKLSAQERNAEMERLNASVSEILGGLAGKIAFSSDPAELPGLRNARDDLFDAFVHVLPQVQTFTEDLLPELIVERALIRPEAKLFGQQVARGLLKSGRPDIDVLAVDVLLRSGWEMDEAPEAIDLLRQELQQPSDNVDMLSYEDQAVVLEHLINTDEPGHSDAQKARMLDRLLETLNPGLGEIMTVLMLSGADAEQKAAKRLVQAMIRVRQPMRPLISTMITALQRYHKDKAQVNAYTSSAPGGAGRQQATITVHLPQITQPASD